ncbi:MAG: hypothetical protein ACTHMM_23440 [Agriterribacter sp.]
MADNYSHLSEEERLKAENDFLKMKLMLENGARFSENSNQSLPPQMENEFLNRIIAFEEQSKNPKYIKVFDKIGRPAFFKPVAEIPESELDARWEELQEHLCRYHITLDVCSPNITVRELYRFTIEELFDYEMDDMHIPGMTTNFIYDEFHPDPVYDNGRMATNECIKQILCKDGMEWTHYFCKENLRLNDHHPLSIDAFKQHVNDFKARYTELEWTDVTCTSCTVQGSDSMATGSYNAEASSKTGALLLSGNWVVNMKRNGETGYWYITGVNVDGIEF